MAYDPYDRGDNPWRSDFGVPRMDMPRANPKAKPGAGRAPAAAPPAKKKVKPTPQPSRRPPGIGGASGRGPESTAEILSNEGEHDYLTGKPLPRAYTLDPERFATPLRTTGPEIAITPDERNVPPPLTNLPPPPDVPPPNIPTGLLAGGGPGATVAPPPQAPGFRMPENARRAAGGIFDTGSVEPLCIPPSSAPPPAPRPAGPRGTPFDTGPVTPMQTPDWLRRLFGAA